MLKYTMSYTVQPISIRINHKFMHHRQFLRWGAFQSAKTDNRLLCNLIFIPFIKVASTYSSIKYFQIFLVSYGRWDFEPYIFMKIFPKRFTVFNWQTIQKCQLFIETPGRAALLWTDCKVTFIKIIQWSINIMTPLTL